MRKTITYQWHLAELMAKAGMHNSTDLLPHLLERGIDLSPSQAYRLVTGRPERVSIQFLAAICDIFDCELNDLITHTAANQTKRRAAAGPNVVDLDKTARPRRAAPGSCPMAIDVNPRNTVQGRPRTIGTHVCARCSRAAVKFRIRWPEGSICGICFHNAMRTLGTCARCRTDRLLPGVDDLNASPICAPCAGIPSIICASCGIEAEHYRRDQCARCCLRSDLQALLLDQANEPDSMRRLLDVLAAAERPESVLTWMRPQEVRDLLRQLATGKVPLSHEGLDAEPRSNRIEHLRSILEAHELLPRRDHHLALFERWLAAKLGAVDDPKIRQPAEQFARWHHLARVRRASRPGTESRAPVHGAKQEITETIRFLTWLNETHHRHLQDCTQLDVESYVADGASTRMIIRTFLVWCDHTRTKPGLTLPHRQARRQPRLTQQERLAWIRELLTGDAESLPYRVTGTLLLLYAQPITRLVTLRTDDLSITPDGPSLTFGTDPVPIPEPFAQMLISHVQDRPNQHGANHASTWLFPSTRAGRHLHPNTVHMRLRALGISNLAARNRAIQDLVMEIPAPIVAKMLGYSDAVATKHAAAAAAPFGTYAARERDPAERIPTRPRQAARSGIDDQPAEWDDQGSV